MGSALATPEVEPAIPIPTNFQRFAVKLPLITAASRIASQQFGANFNDDKHHM
jgi:hypothetical protein